MDDRQRRGAVLLAIAREAIEGTLDPHAPRQWPEAWLRATAAS